MIETNETYDLDNTIVLTGANGEEASFEFLDLIEYLGKEYVVLLPEDDDSGEVVILELDSSNPDEESYINVDDDNIVNAVYAIFKEKYKDEFNFEDSETKTVSNGPIKCRSRLGLWFIAWLSAFAGGHYNWLGYKEEGARFRAEHGIIRAVFNPACWIIHIWEQIAILFGKYREDAYGNPIRYFAFLRNTNKK